MNDYSIKAPLILIMTCCLSATLLADNDFKAKEYKSSDGTSLPYRMHIPKKIKRSQKYPLVLFFHGAGQRGADNKQQIEHGIRGLLAYSKKNKEPLIIVAPQCPVTEMWVNTPWGADAHTMPENPSTYMALTIELLEELQSTLPVDTARIYVTGLSMGGFGTWDIVQRMPKTFAAAMPVCGGGDTEMANVIKDVPICVFHGGADGVVKTKRSRDMVAALEKVGSKVKYTEYDGVGHNSWDKAYEDEEAMKWFLEKKKNKLKEKDTIVFLGDSITQAGVKRDGYVTLTSKAIAKAYPDKNIKVIGAGISGHKVPDCQKRLKRDVLQKKPTIVFIYIGINDVWHSLRGCGTEKIDFEVGLKDMIGKINAVGARVILCTPTVIGEKIDGTNELDKTLEEYSNISREISKETNSQLLDLREAFMVYLKEHNTENAAKGILTADSVHLNKEGNRFLSTLVLDALNVPRSEK